MSDDKVTKLVEALASGGWHEAPRRTLSLLEPHRGIAFVIELCAEWGIEPVVVWPQDGGRPYYDNPETLKRLAVYARADSTSPASTPDTTDAPDGTARDADGNLRAIEDGHHRRVGLARDVVREGLYGRLMARWKTHESVTAEGLHDVATLITLDLPDAQVVSIARAVEPDFDGHDAPAPSLGSFRAARGVFGWQAGDEPAEQSVRRLRDGDKRAQLDYEWHEEND